MPSEMNAQARPLKLLMHRSEAVKFLNTQIEKGNALREQKIRSATGLERAREQKLEWTQSTTVMLSKIFDSDSVIEEYNAWKGKILPEFADLDRFIEHFYDEMDQRIGKLQSILKRVESEPDIVRRKDLSHAHAQSHSASHAVTQGPSHVATPQRQSQVTLSSLDQPVPAPAPVMSQPQTRSMPSPSQHSPMSHSSSIGGHTTSQGNSHVSSPGNSHSSSQHSSSSHNTSSHNGSSQHNTISHSPPQHTPMQTISSQQMSRVGVLIIHERDEDVEKALAQFIRRLGFELLMITESTEGIKTAIERVGQQTQIGFAMLLASAEDIAGAQSLDQPLSPAARRAAFDMGYCCGKLGPDRVCVLHISSAGLFHDENGVNYIPIDAAEGWQIQLAKQLKRSGLDVDLNKVVG